MSDDHTHEPGADDAADPAPLDPAIAARLAVEPLDELTRRRLRAAALEAFDGAGGATGTAGTTGTTDEPARPAGPGGDGGDIAEVAALRPRRTLMWLAPVAAAAAALALVVAVNTGGNDADQPVATGATDTAAKQEATVEPGERGFFATSGDGRSVEPETPPSTAPPGRGVTPAGGGQTEAPPDAAFVANLPDLGEVSDPEDLQGAIDNAQPPSDPPTQRPTTTTTGTPPDGGVGVQVEPGTNPACIEVLGQAVILLQAQGTYDGREVVIYVIADLAAAPSADQTAGIAIVVALDNCAVLSRESVTVER